MDSKQLDVIVRKFYAVADLAHIEHENAVISGSYARHVALGDFNDKVIDHKDRLIEYLIGERKITKVSAGVLELGMDIEREAMNLKEMFCKCAMDCEDEALENMAGEFEEAVGKLRYLLMFK